MKHSMIVAVGVLVVVTWLLSAPASAGLIAIAIDPNAMPAWQGTQQFYAASGGKTLDVDVEYAVYAPGHYGLSGTDPSGGKQFVYAYQVYVTGTAPLELREDPVGRFAVGEECELDLPVGHYALRARIATS